MIQYNINIQDNDNYNEDVDVYVYPKNALVGLYNTITEYYHKIPDAEPHNEKKVMPWDWITIHTV